jgi:hypothetical protein
MDPADCKCVCEYMQLYSSGNRRIHERCQGVVTEGGLEGLLRRPFVTKGASKILRLWLTGQVEQRCQSTSTTQEHFKFQQN